MRRFTHPPARLTPYSRDGSGDPVPPRATSALDSLSSKAIPFALATGGSNSPSADASCSTLRHSSKTPSTAAGRRDMLARLNRAGRIMVVPAAR